MRAIVPQSKFYFKAKSHYCGDNNHMYRANWNIWLVLLRMRMTLFQMLGPDQYAFMKWDSHSIDAMKLLLVTKLASEGAKISRKGKRVLQDSTTSCGCNYCEMVLSVHPYQVFNHSYLHFVCNTCSHVTYIWKNVRDFLIVCTWPPWCHPGSFTVNKH